MTCSHVGSGCNAPEGECLGFCLNKGYEVQYKNGTKLTDRKSGAVFVVSGSNAEETQYQGASGRGTVKTSEVAALFEVDGEPMPTVAEVLRRWLTPEEFRGYMKGTAIAYLAREQDKGGMLDIKKAGHTLQGLVELSEVE